MATDLRYQLLDEIALEGLDGITINTLWIRLKQRLDFKLKLDDACKSYLWNCLLCQQDIECYKLPEERPDLIPYNRFHYLDPDTHHFLETEHVPDDIYPVCVINDDGIRGSCVTYKTRTNITAILRDTEHRVSLQEARERYGNCLVLVASQPLRWRTLIGEESDPNYSLTDIQYCVVERIARARYQGETAVGKLSLQAFKESQKTIFYFIKKIHGLGVVKKQGITVVFKDSNRKAHVILYHLKRFYTQMKHRWLYELQNIADYVSTCPDQMIVVSALRAYFNFKDTHLKKLLQRTDESGERFFEYREMPYRHVYPDAPSKEYLSKGERTERVIRHVKLIKHPKDTDIVQTVDSDEEPLEEKTDDSVKFVQVYNKPALAQLYSFIKNHGSKGVCQTDIEQTMGLDRLAARRQLKMLILHGSITTILQDVGRQKRSMYVSKDALEENVIHQNVTAEMEKFDRMTKGKQTKAPKKSSKKSRKKPEELVIKLNTAPPSDEKTMAIKEELEKVQGGSNQYTVRFKPEQEEVLAMRVEGPAESTFENVTIEESLPGEELEKKRVTDRFGMQRFGTLLTETHIRRANWIIEIVQAIKLLEQYQLRKLIRHREDEMNLQFLMDQKSLKRLVTALVEDQKVKSMKVTIRANNKEKTFNFITATDVTTNSGVVRKAVEEAKLKYFSVSKEELKGVSKRKRAAHPESKPPKKVKKFSADLPESAQDSILKHQNYKKKLLDQPPPMKYDKKAGVMYGLLPKFVRAQKLHQILWYLCYETYGVEMEPIVQTETESNSPNILPVEQIKTESHGTDIQPVEKIGTESHSPDKQPLEQGTVGQPVEQVTDEQQVEQGFDEKQVKQMEAESQDKTDTYPSPTSFSKIDITEGNPKQTTPETMKEPPVYVDELSWKRYLPPVPLHAGYPKGWCFISDILLELPTVVFCQIVNICYDIAGLLEVLNHPVQKFYPVKCLPFEISQQLLFARRYVHSFHENCAILCEMGLLTFGPDIMKQKELTFIYIHNKLSLLDTRESLLGYNKTNSPPGVTFTRKWYNLTDEDSLNSFWEDLQIIGLGSNMGFKSGITPNTEDKASHEEYAMKDALKRKTVSTVEDVGKIPGDMRGAAGLDSSLFCHSLKNWSKHRNKARGMNMIKYKERKLNYGLNKAIPPLKEGGKKYSRFGETWRVKLTKNVRGNKGGKGVKKMREPPRRDQVLGSSSRKRHLQFKYNPRMYKKKTRLERGDEKDRTIFNALMKCRVTWSPQEDTILLFGNYEFLKTSKINDDANADFNTNAYNNNKARGIGISLSTLSSKLLLCNLASLLMEEQRRCLIVTYPVVRDILHEKCPELSTDKTSMSCSRRLKFALKNPQTVQNLSLFYQEALQDQYIVKEYSSKHWVATDEHIINPKFKILVDYLMKKFHSLNVGKCELPETLSKLEEVDIERIGKLTVKKIFSDVTSKTDICHDVLRNILHSSMLLQDKQGRAHEMFKLLTQYPDILLNQVIQEMRTDGLIVLNKSMKTKMKQRVTAGVGLRNFKASQRYMYNYKQRYLSVLFEESAEFLDQLAASHLGEGESQGVELDFSPKGCQSVILTPLMLMRKIDMKVTIPEELVIVDLEGFYHFPWGRGKLASKSEKFMQSAENLEELFPGTDFKKLKLPQESTPVIGADVAETLLNDDAGTEDGDEETLKETDTTQEAESDMETDKHDAEAHERDKTGDTEDIHKGMVESAGDESVGMEKDKTVEIANGESNETVLMKESGGIQSEAVPTTAGNDKRSEVEKENSVSVTAIGPERIASSAEKETEKSENPEIKYEVYKHGSSEMIIPPYEVVLKKTLSQEQQNIASRTLLSLRRSDKEAVEEIRIFNAQDNFVVNSCAIRVNLKSSKKTSSSDKESSETDKTQDEESTVRGLRTRREKQEARYEARKRWDNKKEKVLDSLIVKNEQIKKIQDNLQQILPFQLDMQKVWQHLQVIGLSGSEVTMCQQVYDVIEKARELGIKMHDLQKHFSKAFTWRRYVQILIEQTAKI